MLYCYQSDHNAKLGIEHCIHVYIESGSSFNSAVGLDCQFNWFKAFKIWCNINIEPTHAMADYSIQTDGDGIK